MLLTRVCPSYIKFQPRHHHLGYERLLVFHHRAKTNLPLISSCRILALRPAALNQSCASKTHYPQSWYCEWRPIRFTSSWFVIWLIFEIGYMLELMGWNVDLQLSDMWKYAGGEPSDGWKQVWVSKLSIRISHLSQCSSIDWRLVHIFPRGHLKHHCRVDS